MTTALIDADILIYYVLAARKVDFGDGDPYQQVPDVEVAVPAAMRTIAQWTDEAGCDDAFLVFSDRTKAQSSFRYQVYENYKSNRVNAKPNGYAAVQRDLESRYPSRWHPALEGDDVIGLMVTKPANKGKYVVLSTDKDMRTLPGARIYNMTKQTFEIIDRSQADVNWMYQVLRGDSCDGYPGAPGIGEKAADGLRSILRDCHDVDEMWDLVIDVYKDQEQTHFWKKFKGIEPCELALQMARLSRIARHGDFKIHPKPRGSIKLWTPYEESDEWLKL